MLLIFLLVPLSAWFLTARAAQFLLANKGLPLTRKQVSSVTAVFMLSGLSVVSLNAGTDVVGTLKCGMLLAWGVPLVLLDLRHCWLPFRFTTGFWLTGLLFTLLPGSSLSLTEALIGSSGMFMLLYAFYYVAKHLRGEEGFGRGDVHLIAALCAWLPWPLASLLSGCGFLLFIVGALLTQKSPQPYAPWLFALLAGLTAGFPKLILGSL